MATPLYHETALTSESDARYRQFLREYPLLFATLDGVQFWINPDSFQMSSEWNRVNVITRAGFGRVTYTANPTTVTLVGTTGMGGMGKLLAMEKFRPLITNKDRYISFTFPARFAGTWYCFINSFTDSLTNAAQFYAFYNIELQIFPKLARQSVQKLASSVGLTIALPPKG